MRKSAFLAGLVLCVPIFGLASPHTKAETPHIVLANSTNVIEGQHALEVVNVEVQKPATKPEEQKPLEHTVAEGETLSSIAQQHQTTWERLYAKNTNISNPDVIDVGLKLVVPKADEQLAERAVPVVEAPETLVQSRSTIPKQAVKPSARGSSSGNTYSAGYCTWYAKNRRPDLPNNLGNAATWVSRAAAQGIPTGSSPRPGAIGQRGNHVVYVESVNGDGSVNVSEMNHKGWSVVSSRTVPGNYFTYIY